MNFPSPNIPLSGKKDLKTLVENRSAFTLNSCELNVFETYERASLVRLNFRDLVITNMLKGKKIMHLEEKPEFEYLPGEAAIHPPNEKMEIDFPEADENNPTQCVALAIDALMISQILNTLNERYPRENKADYWQLTYHDYHFRGDELLATMMNKVIQVCSEDNPHKDILAELSIQELLIRIIQKQNINALSGEKLSSQESPVLSVIRYIKDNLGSKIKIDQLCKIACMSRGNFFRVFKREFGISPIEYILYERIRKAKQMLSYKQLSTVEICYHTGFMDLNYFQRQFKKIEGMTPGQYRLLVSLESSGQSF